LVRLPLASADQTAVKAPHLPLAVYADAALETRSVMSGYSAELRLRVSPFFIRLPTDEEASRELCFISTPGPLTQRDVFWLAWENARAWLYMHFLKPNARHTPPLMEALSMGALLALQQFFPDEFEDSERAWSELVRDAEAWARECEQFRSRALNFELYEDKRGLAIDEQRRMIASRASMSLSDLLARIRAHKRTLFVELGLSPDVSDDALMADLSEIVRNLGGSYDKLLYRGRDGRARIHERKILDGLRRIYGRRRREDLPAEAEEIGSDALRQPAAAPSSDPSLDAEERDLRDAYEALVVRAERDARSPRERLVAKVLRWPELLGGTVSVAEAVRVLHRSESAVRRALREAQEQRDEWLARQEDPRPRRKIRD
jgi:hypothetical protein